VSSETEQLVLKAFGWTKEQLENAIKEKQREYEGLASKESVLDLLVEEKTSEEKNRETITVGEKSFAQTFAQSELVDLEFFAQARAGLFASFNARVVKVFAPREFEKNGRRGRVASVLLADLKSASAVLVLWNDLVSLVEGGVFQRNACVRVENVFVKREYPLEFYARGETRVLRVEDSAQKFCSVFPARFVGLSDVEKLSEGSEVDVEALVLDSREPKEFVSKDGKRGIRQWLLLGDGAASVPLVAWNNVVSLSRKLAPGDKTRLESVFVKKNAVGAFELHANNQSMVFLLGKSELANNPGSNAGLNAGSLSPLQASPQASSPASLQVQQLAFLREGSQALVQAKIVNVLDARVARKCVACGQREGFCSCSKKSWRETLFVSVIVEDESGQKQAVFFSEDAKKLLQTAGISDGFGIKESEGFEIKEGFSVENVKALVGKSFSAVVLPRVNRFSNELECVIKKLVSVS